MRRIDYIEMILISKGRLSSRDLSLQVMGHSGAQGFASPSTTASTRNAQLRPARGPTMTASTNSPFNITTFLAQTGRGRRMVRLSAKQVFFAQGANADSVFYLQTGRAKLTVVSERGKEATITMLTSGDFIGEESIASAPSQRMATATAVTACNALRIDRDAMISVMHDEHRFSDLFLSFLLARGMRTQADLVDQLFNSSEKRLARILLLMAEFGQARRD